MRLMFPLLLLALTGCANMQYTSNPDRWERPKVSWQDTYDKIQMRKAIKKYVKE